MQSNKVMEKYRLGSAGRFIQSSSCDPNSSGLVLNGFVWSGCQKWPLKGPVILHCSSATRTSVRYLRSDGCFTAGPPEGSDESSYRHSANMVSADEVVIAAQLQGNKNGGGV